MNASQRASFDTIPHLVDAAGMPALACAIREGGEWRTAWLIGTRKQAFGAAYPSARAAADAAHYLNEVTL